MTNTFGSTKKFNAVRAVTNALRKIHGPEFIPTSGVDYTLTRNGDVWIATVIEKGAAPHATAEATVQLNSAGQLTDDGHRAIADVAATIAAQVVANRAKAAATPVKGGKRAAATDAAKRGELPQAPDFSAPTHASFRKRLDAIKALVAAGDVAGLKEDTTEPKSSSRTMLCRYRDLAIMALEARAAAAGKVGA